MKFKGTLLLLVLTVLVIWGYRYAEERVPATLESKEKQKRIFEFKSEDVHEIAIKGVDRDLLFERQGSLWLFKKPLQVRANSPEIEGLLSAMQYMERNRRMTPKDIADSKLSLRDFGLEKPRIAVSLKTKSGTVVLNVGSEARQGDGLYIQVSGDPHIYRVDRDVALRLSKKMDDLRDRSLFDVTASQVQHLEIKSGPKLLEFTRTNHLWRIVQPLSARADPDRVEEFLRQTASLRVDEFLSEDATALKEYGLEEPTMEVSIKIERQEAPVTLLLGQKLKNDPKKIAAKLKGQTSIISIPSSYGEELAKPLNEYRERSLGKFKLADIHEIELHNRQMVTTIQREGDGWKISQPELMEADKLLVEKLLGRLSALHIKDFSADVLTDIDKFGLKAPLYTIVLKGKPAGEENAVPIQVLNVAFGKEDAAKKLSYVKISDDSSIYGLDTSDLADLPRSAMDLRSRLLFNLKKEALKSCTQKRVREGKSSITFNRTGEGKWQLADGTQGVVDETAWQKFQNEVEHLTVEKIIGTALNPTLKQYGLDSPVVTLTLVSEIEGKEVTQEILVGRESQKRFYLLWKTKLLVCEISEETYRTLTSEWLAHGSAVR